ncbi:uncharacterized protein LOC119730290 isoform X2 [Patiria miniata]|uniref:Poly [ADP-ribose] polymerase n=1 Tax=Patiria miniata TaxID=46514 RepID=A0A914A5M6_PATMI|nr:uncharacterized protein LOC119730290 isoform X2 [Patiria miniata]
MGIFSNCQISLDLDAIQVPFKKKQLLRKQVTSNGGVISYILTKKTTYLVASNGPKTADSYKGRTAQKQGVPIVSVSFIERCVEEGKLLDHDDFLLVGKTTSMQFSSGKITSTKTQQEPKKQMKVSSFNINKFKVWPWGSIDAPAYPEEKYEVAKSVLLQKTDVRSKDRIFYQLELHVVPDDVFNLARSSEDTEPEIAYTFRVFTHRGVLDNIMDEDSGTREVRYCSTSEEALELYSFLYQQQHNMSRSKKVASRWIGSPKYRQTQLSIGEHEDDEMSGEVASLVASLWKETLGELEDILAVDVKTLTAEKISKAESILLQIRKALDSRSDGADDDEREISIAELTQEFYSQIPHKTQQRKDIRTKSLIAKKQELCQLIKDVVSVSETTNWSQRSSVESKYRALRCHISCLPHNHPQYYDVKNLIVSTQGEKPVEILRVFAVTRPLELTSFDAKLHNSRLLFHASRPANFVGILSRGLVLPKVVVDDFGGERTDAGMLGSGIYFADSFSTSAKYSHASQARGTRLMAVNQVALGECYQTTSYKKDFTEAPEGFHSVHGVKNNGTNHSDFKDDEFAVYSTAQQRIRYVVEFTLPGDKPMLTTGPIGDSEGAVHSEDDSDSEASEEEVDKMGVVDLSDVQSIEDPLSKVQPGLLSSNDQPIPLKAVHVRARLLDLAAQVVVLQVYANDSDFPIEAKYVFPLDGQAAVCGFEAFINDKHIVGEVKEKETAHKEYKEAISKGHGAYLMDEEKPDVFTVSVGNLPPMTTVVIKITYVAELSVDGDKILFALPGSVAPWRKDAAFAQETQTDVTTVKVDTDTERSLSVHISVEMPYDIRSLESPTHPIKHKQTASKATVCLADDCRGLDDGFQLLIGLAEIHVPRMWVEKHPQDSDSQACMLTFYPEFEAEKNDQSEVVLLLDLSNSMRGGSILQEAQKVVLLTLHHLPKDWKFNIVVFGTDFEELFPQSRTKTPDTLKSARNFLQGLSASMGNTDVWRPLRAYFMLKSGALRNVFFFSDGHVSNEDATLDAVRRNCRHTRVFTFGISATANKYLLRAMSTAGAGAFEFFDSKIKSKWEGKVQAQLSKASQPVLSAVRVDWCQFDDDAPEPVQAPNHITSLFSGSRQVVYGFVPYCTQATLRANNDGKDVSTMVSTHELSITEGKILHQLTARNVIRDWEEGALATDRTQHEAKKAEQKSYIIDLSKKYSIVTQFTSFVAVEVRDKEEEHKPKTGVDVADLLSKEEVDALSYLGWQEDKSHDAPVPMTQDDKVAMMADLLEKAEMEASFSVMRAESLYEKILETVEGLPVAELDQHLLEKTAKQLKDFYGNVKRDEDMLDRARAAVHDEALVDFAMSDEGALDDYLCFSPYSPTSPGYYMGEAPSYSSALDSYAEDDEMCMEFEEEGERFRRGFDAGEEKYAMMEDCYEAMEIRAVDAKSDADDWEDDDDYDSDSEVSENDLLEFLEEQEKLDEQLLSSMPPRTRVRGKARGGKMMFGEKKAEGLLSRDVDLAPDQSVKKTEEEYEKPKERAIMWGSAQRHRRREIPDEELKLQGNTDGITFAEPADSSLAERSPHRFPSPATGFAFSAPSPASQAAHPALQAGDPAVAEALSSSSVSTGFFTSTAPRQARASKFKSMLPPARLYKAKGVSLQGEAPTGGLFGGPSLRSGFDEGLTLGHQPPLEAGVPKPQTVTGFGGTSVAPSYGRVFGAPFSGGMFGGPSLPSGFVEGRSLGRQPPPEAGIPERQATVGFGGTSPAPSSGGLFGAPFSGGLFGGPSLHSGFDEGQTLGRQPPSEASIPEFQTQSGGLFGRPSLHSRFDEERPRGLQTRLRAGIRGHGETTLSDNLLEETSESPSSGGLFGEPVVPPVGQRPIPAFRKQIPTTSMLKGSPKPKSDAGVAPIQPPCREARKSAPQEPAKGDLLSKPPEEAAMPESFKSNSKGTVGFSDRKPQQIRLEAGGVSSGFSFGSVPQQQQTAGEFASTRKKDLSKLLGILQPEQTEPILHARSMAWPMQAANSPARLTAAPPRRFAATAAPSPPPSRNAEVSTYSASPPPPPTAFFAGIPPPPPPAHDGIAPGQPPLPLDMMRRTIQEALERFSSPSGRPPPLPHAGASSLGGLSGKATPATLGQVRQRQEMADDFASTKVSASAGQTSVTSGLFGSLQSQQSETTLHAQSLALPMQATSQSAGSPPPVPPCPRLPLPRRPPPRLPFRPRPRDLYDESPPPPPPARSRMPPPLPPPLPGKEKAPRQLGKGIQEPQLGQPAAAPLPRARHFNTKSYSALLGLESTAEIPDHARVSRSSNKESSTPVESNKVRIRQELSSDMRRNLKKDAAEVPPQFFDTIMAFGSDDAEETYTCMAADESHKPSDEGYAPAKVRGSLKKKKKKAFFAVSEDRGKDVDEEQIGKETEEIPSLQKASLIQDARSQPVVELCRMSPKMRPRGIGPKVSPKPPPLSHTKDIVSDLLGEIEISTAISAPLGFGTTESKFRKHNGDFSLEAIIKLLKHQNEDGSWELFMGIKEHVGVRLKPVKNMLKEAGVNSLGEDVALKIQKLVATYLVILYLNHFLAQSPTMSRQERERITQAVLNAERFVSQAEAEYPSLARRLELGSSWDDVCQDIFKMM